MQIIGHKLTSQSVCDRRGFPISARGRVFINTPEFSVMEDFLQRVQARAVGNDEVWIRGSRAFRKQARAYIDSQPLVCEELGIKSSKELTWSRTAMCACGCSPGFIITSFGTGYGKNHWLDFEIKEPEKVVDN